IDSNQGAVTSAHAVRSTSGKSASVESPTLSASENPPQSRRVNGPFPPYRRRVPPLTPCSASSSSSGAAGEPASSATACSSPRGGTTRSPAVSARTSDLQRRSADPSRTTWNFADESPSTRKPHGARSSDRQRIVLRTANVRSTSETASGAGEASFVIVYARTTIAADQP